jgi:hypothetical protein
MTSRTIRTTVTFQQPFVLAGVDRRYPAGACEVQTDEETIDNLSFVAWRRVATTVLVHAGGAAQSVRIEPTELDTLPWSDGTASSAPGNAPARG